MSDIKFYLKHVGVGNLTSDDSEAVGITGHFVIPSYQRGYRWGKKEVSLLVKDILKSEGKPYCLQPIVVKRLKSKASNEERYELIDGQQRLTTLYLLYKFLNISSNGFLPEPKFSLEYETREKSASFLKNIELDKANDNIDFWYIVNAWKTIESLLPPVSASLKTNINKYLDESVNVIWYEVPDTEDGRSLFQRLNIGKIPLTSSELVKALFLRDVPEESIKNRQEEISLQWDNMERDLHNGDFWAFLTNKKTDKFATRIDLVLDMMAGKKENDRDPLSTFFYFYNIAEKKECKLYDIWKEIQATFLKLKEWRYDHELYHKIGFLVASGAYTLSYIFNLSKRKRKTTFRKEIDTLIRRSLRNNQTDTNHEMDITELNYHSDYKKIERILLLFNVESMRTLNDDEKHDSDGKQWFPFEMHKDKKWSLEHIHAQHSEGLNTNEKRLKWLEAHLKSLESLRATMRPDKAELSEFDTVIGDTEKLITDIENNTRTPVGDRFISLQERIVELLSLEKEQMHGIDNLALLDVGSNSALSNYVFDAKRNIVINMDKHGKYIPFCTKMVFFKYYSDPDKIQLHFWGPEDRDCYMKAINEKLACYLNEINENHKDL